jgi:predicted metal-dependent hydrolase
MKVIVNWETDNEKVDLPEKVEVPDNISEEEIADWLSDKYGWLVNSYSEIK